MSDFITICEQAARAGGAVLRQYRGRFTSRQKGPKDLVSDADLASQQTIREIVLGAFPDHGFVGEEGQMTRDPDCQFHWVVDPLDGTLNYVHGVPHFATSVALCHEGRPIAGAVFDPSLQECFTAAENQGARLNGESIRLADGDPLAELLVAASFPTDVQAGAPIVHEFTAVLAGCQAIRRGGSAALNLAYVAAGRFGAFWASDLYPWDAAAGALLVQEAGGIVTSRDGGPFDVWAPRLIAASGLRVHDQLLKLIGPDSTTAADHSSE